MMVRLEKFGICIFNNMGMVFGINIIGLYEGIGKNIWFICLVFFIMNLKKLKYCMCVVYVLFLIK